MQYAYTTGTPGTVQQIVSYAYGDADWKDKLTRYNGVDIAYDAIGNPIHDGVWAYTWENGRQLRRMACDATIAEFMYNADGLRVQKTVNGVATNYTLHGKNIVHMTKGNAELHFWYDAQNRPAIVEFNGTKYGYLYNLQGDVIGLIDGANNEVVRYTYDAWGKPLSVTGSLANTIGYYNPFRYRSYVYDVETGLYYLRSRYYNPSWGRFVNADNRIDNNLYTYCPNRPSMEIDDSGNTGREIMEGCNGILSGTHSLDDEMLQAATFIEMLEYMVEEQWMYPDVNERGERYPTSWGVADCYGIYVACMKAYYTPEDFEKLDPGTTCYWAYERSTYKRCIRNRGKLVPSEVQNLQIGMAVLITRVDNNGRRLYDHIAYVAGFNEDGSVDLIESNIGRGNRVTSVKHITLTDKYVWAIKLAGIAY